MISIKPIPKLFIDEVRKCEEIFFETSSKTDFKNVDDKSKLKQIYFSYYLDFFPEYSFAILSDNKVAGYILGAPETLNETMLKLHPYLKNFIDDIELFPAHLHVHISVDFQGRHLGEKLVNFFSELLRQQDVKGVHIITSTDARNKSFYQRQGFIYERNSGKGLSFMGKYL